MDQLGPEERGLRVRLGGEACLRTLEERKGSFQTDTVEVMTILQLSALRDM
jgi:hypothetical protein